MSFFTSTCYVIVGDKAQIKELYDILYPAAEKIEAADDDDDSISLVIDDVCKALGTESTLAWCMSLRGVEQLSERELKFCSYDWKSVSEMGKIIHEKYPELDIYYMITGFDTPDSNQYTNDIGQKYYRWGYRIDDIGLWYRPVGPNPDHPYKPFEFEDLIDSIRETECDKVWKTKFEALKYLSDKYNNGVFLDEKGWKDRTVFFCAIVPCNDECVSFEYPIYRLTISSLDSHVINEVRELFQKYALGTFALLNETKKVSKAMYGELNINDQTVPPCILSDLTEEKGENGVIELGLNFYLYDDQIADELKQRVLESIADGLKAKWDFTIPFNYMKIVGPITPSPKIEDRGSM